LSVFSPSFPFTFLAFASRRHLRGQLRYNWCFDAAIEAWHATRRTSCCSDNDADPSRFAAAESTKQNHKEIEDMSADDQVIKDPSTVTAQGVPLARLAAGVTFRDVPVHSDERGSIRELFDPRWNWHPDPLVFAYFFTIRPGMIKGWGMHKLHEDRYFTVAGEMEVILYDERPGSPTEGEISRVVLAEYHSRLMNIPAGVWHANRNIGSKDAMIVNFPTLPYDHANPDKYRLPLNTDRIPFKFDNPRGF
jgi:dTDP-4-dehydrorhamnose 3,5-epimerase